MEEFKGTKGNWSYSKETGTIRGHGDLLAELLINGSEDHNGTLMAAAPELLQALQALINSYDSFSVRNGRRAHPENPMILNARKALSKE